jgi:hypothetical protein
VVIGKYAPFVVMSSISGSCFMVNPFKFAAKVSASIASSSSSSSSDESSFMRAPAPPAPRSAPMVHRRSSSSRLLNSRCSLGSGLAHTSAAIS